MWMNSRQLAVTVSIYIVTGVERGGVLLILWFSYLFCCKLLSLKNKIALLA